MPKLYCFLVFFLLSCPFLRAQFHTVSGIITNNKLEPLAFASVEVKELKRGILSQADGSYFFKLEEGKYDLVVSMVGFTGKVVTVIVNKNITQNIILDPAATSGLSEVVVKAKMKDRAEEFIRHVIQHKESVLAAVGPYSCDIYSRAVAKDSFVVSNKKAKLDTSTQNLLNKEFAKISLAEVSLRYDQSASGKIHEERMGVSRRGNPDGLFYLSATEGDFNLYNNLIVSRVLSVVPFISPVSYSGLLAYRYKTVSTVARNGHKQYTISFRPGALSNATLEGQLVIDDSAWVILSASFRLPRFHLPEYDFFEVDQQYEPVGDSAWMITRQKFSYYSKQGKGKRSGETVASYQHFVLNKMFPKGYFGNEVSTTAQEAYERDSSFWVQTRTAPLTSEQIAFIRFKDSVYHATHTKQYLDSIDRLINKITWKKIGFLGQTLHNHEKEQTWDLPTVLGLYQPLQFGGTRINPSGSYDRVFPSKKEIYAYANISYGLRNKDVNGSLHFTHLYNPFNRSFFRVSGGREFGAIFDGDAWINQLKRSNVFLDHSIGVGHGRELVNGLFLYSDLDFAYRRSVSDYAINTSIDSLFPDLLDDNQAIAFASYNALYGKLKLAYTPGQRYIREPRQKVILGSAWPTFYGLWRKGIPGILKSKVNFDYLEFGIEQTFRISTLGSSSYTFLTGNFLNKRDLRLIDYKFQRRGDPLLFSNPNEAFQSLDSTFPVFRRFYQAHYMHEFNGYLLNKIPLLKKLRLREVAGAGFLYAQERNLRYAEVFAGVERVFKWPFSPLAKFKLGFYVVGSAANQFRNPVQCKIGITTWDKFLSKWR